MLFLVIKNFLSNNGHNHQIEDTVHRVRKNLLAGYSAKDSYLDDILLKIDFKIQIIQ